MRYIYFTMIFLLVGLLMGCGQKGDLYLPGDSDIKPKETLSPGNVSINTVEDSSQSLDRAEALEKTE